MVPRHRGEVVRAENRRAALFALAQKTYDALLKIRAIHPLETAGLLLSMVERGLISIQAVELRNPTLQSSMLGLVDQVPVEALLVTPLLPLSKFSAHEEQLLSRLPPHVTKEKPQISELLPHISRHLA